MMERIRKYLKSLEKEAIPQVSVNCVIFGFHDRKLKVVINRISFSEAAINVLPGGYIRQNEDLSHAVQRVVMEGTGLEKILLKQFSVFGDASRSFGPEFEKLKVFREAGAAREVQWLSRRFLSICYLGLVDYNKIVLRPTQFMEAAEWLDVEKARILHMDHSEIVKSARETLMKELPYSPIASNLLPAKFTLPDLHALVEAILGRPVDRPNFRRKVLASDMLVKVGQDDSGKRRPADLYIFRRGKKTSIIDDLRLGF